MCSSLLNYSLWCILWKVVVFFQTPVGCSTSWWRHGWLCRPLHPWTACVGDGLCWFNAQGCRMRWYLQRGLAAPAISFLNADHFWPCSVSYCEASLHPHTLVYQPCCFYLACSLSFFLPLNPFKEGQSWGHSPVGSCVGWRTLNVLYFVCTITLYCCCAFLYLIINSWRAGM